MFRDLNKACRTARLFLKKIGRSSVEKYKKLFNKCAIILANFVNKYYYII